MRVGTKSVLWGVHAFWFHGFSVGLAWRKLFGAWPNWAEWVCIFSHDIGYLGKRTMDGPDGRTHPVLGAKLASKIVGFFKPELAEWAYVSTVSHSREYAKLFNMAPSRLCWADKFCCWYDPAWFYLLRAHLSGEIYEFRANAIGHIPEDFNYREWFSWYRKKTYFLPEIQKLLCEQKSLASRRRSCIFPF